PVIDPVKAEMGAIKLAAGGAARHRKARRRPGHSEAEEPIRADLIVEARGATEGVIDSIGTADGRVAVERLGAAEGRGPGPPRLRPECARLRADRGEPRRAASPRCPPSLVWVPEFMPDRSMAAAMGLFPTGPFIVDGPRAAPDSARIEAGSNIYLTRNVAFFGTFIGEYSSRSSNNAGNGG